MDYETPRGEGGQCSTHYKNRALSVFDLNTLMWSLLSNSSAEYKQKQALVRFLIYCLQMTDEEAPVVRGAAGSGNQGHDADEHW